MRREYRTVRRDDVRIVVVERTAVVVRGAGDRNATDAGTGRDRKIATRSLGYRAAISRALTATVPLSAAAVVVCILRCRCCGFFQPAGSTASLQSHTACVRAPRFAPPRRLCAAPACVCTTRFDCFAGTRRLRAPSCTSFEACRE